MRVPQLTSNQALPWYRVIPPFSWLTRQRMKRLRPAGHAVWVEAMHQPVLVAISCAFISAALYVLGKDYFIAGVHAVLAGDTTQLIPLSLALFVIVVTGLAVEIGFLTAASRLRMHLSRQEWWWALPSGIMLLFTLFVDGMTCSYMLYQIEHPNLPPALTAFILSIPSSLFVIRAFAALICAVYLIVFVLPLVIRQMDIRRELAAQSGSAKVAIIQSLMNSIPDMSVGQKLNLYPAIAAIFRDNAQEGDLVVEDESTLRALNDLWARMQGGMPTAQDVVAALPEGLAKQLDNIAQQLTALPALAAKVTQLELAQERIDASDHLLPAPPSEPAEFSQQVAPRMSAAAHMAPVEMRTPSGPIVKPYKEELPPTTAKPKSTRTKKPKEDA